MTGSDHAPPPDHPMYPAEIRSYFVNILWQIEPNKPIPTKPPWPLFLVTLQIAISAWVLYNIGAPLSLSYHVYFTLPPALKLPHNPSPVRFTQEGTRRPYHSFGTCDLKILIKNQTVIQEVHILQGLPNDVILGNNFMQQHALFYDMETMYSSGPMN
jgi:hypothetical protein